jgi:hypothetical protein
MPVSRRRGESRGACRSRPLEARPRALSILIESEWALYLFGGARSCPKTGSHFSGSCSSPASPSRGGRNQRRAQRAWISGGGAVARANTSPARSAPSASLPASFDLSASGRWSGARLVGPAKAGQVHGVQALARLSGARSAEPPAATRPRVGCGGNGGRVSGILAFPSLPVARLTGRDDLSPGGPGEHRSPGKATRRLRARGEAAAARAPSAPC